MQTQLVGSTMVWLVKMQPAARTKELCLSVTYMVYHSVIQANKPTNKRTQESSVANARSSV